jgi:hypothetical protein
MNLACAYSVPDGKHPRTDHRALCRSGAEDQTRKPCRLTRSWKRRSKCRVSVWCDSRRDAGDSKRAQIDALLVANDYATPVQRAAGLVKVGERLLIQRPIQHAQRQRGRRVITSVIPIAILLETKGYKSEVTSSRTAAGSVPHGVRQYAIEMPAGDCPQKRQTQTGTLCPPAAISLPRDHYER